ncbi:unnamed protein product [Discosporangium mesarthrocarpum]
MAEVNGLESSGTTDQFEHFSFDEPVRAKRVKIFVRGTSMSAWNTVNEVQVCYTSDTPSIVDSLGVTLTYIGCFADDSSGESRAIVGRHVQLEDLTPSTCAFECQGYKYIGLQYSSECFCGDSYFTESFPAVQSDACTMPCVGDPEHHCGGSWANSVYAMGDPIVETPEELEALGALGNEGDGPPRREIKVTNNCQEAVRVGATGGFVTSSDDDCPDGSVLDAAVGACFWSLPLPEDGKSYDISRGESITVKLHHQARNGVRWSGNIWGATGCDSAVACETAFCMGNTGFPDGYCPPSTGPLGPVTKAEFTLVDTGVDFYDVSAIDGVNLPMEMKPNTESSPLWRDDDYWCSNPGGADTLSNDLGDCSWKFDPSDVEELGDMSRYLRWVENDGSLVNCQEDSDCDKNLDGEETKCGTMFGRNSLNGAPSDGLFPMMCGRPLGWHSAGGICGSSGYKPLGYFPNSYPFMCEQYTGQDAANSTLGDLYSCRGGIYSESGYSIGAAETSCGCPDWPEEGIPAPSSGECHANNPLWDRYSLPWLKFLKVACPTTYSFPFDDHSSTFVCANNDRYNTHEGDNSMSYEIVFCPADTEENMLE